MNERRIERVARAICWQIGVNPDDRYPVTKRLIWQHYVPQAEAAVRALSSCLTPEYDSKKREDLYVELD